MKKKDENTFRMNYKLFNNNGFSLTSVLMATVLLAGLSLAFMQLMKNMGQGQIFAQSKAEELELKTSIRMLLSSEKHCRVSLAGNMIDKVPITPVTFYKENIDEDNEGLDIALYLANQSGDTRGLKKFNGANSTDDEDLSKFGKLTITSITLLMNNGTGSNYSQSPDRHNDIGQLRVLAKKKISYNQTRMITMNFDLNVEMSTNSSGETTILSCSRNATSNPIYSRAFRAKGASGYNYNKVNLISGDITAFELINNVNNMAGTHNNLDGIGCASGWTLVSCSGSSTNGNNDYFDHTSGCITNDYDQMALVITSITCTKDG